MSEKGSRQTRRFDAHETERAKALDGAPLATFGQRVLGYAVDLAIAVVIWAPMEFAWRHFLLHEQHVELKWDFHEAGNIVVMLLYLGLANYFWQRKDPGKMGGARQGGVVDRGANGTVAVSGAGAWIWGGCA